MSDNLIWFVKKQDGAVYGPADFASLIRWAQEGRIDPDSLISSDKINWATASLTPELEMNWMVETAPGNVFGPFNRQLVIKLFNEGKINSNTPCYKKYEYPIDEDPPVCEKIVEKEVRVEVPVEKIVEKVVEVPVDKVVEKIVEKEVRVEVPVEKIVEKVVEVPVDKVVEKIVEKEVRVEVPVEKIVEKIVEVPVEKVVDKIVEKEVRVEVPVEKIIEKVVEVPVEKVVDRIVEKEVRVEVPVEKIVEKVVEVPVEKVVEKIVEKEVRVEVPVEKIVEKIVEVEKVVEVISPDLKANNVSSPKRVNSPIKSLNSLNHDALVALEQAARQELMRSGKFSIKKNFFGGKKS